MEIKRHLPKHKKIGKENFVLLNAFFKLKNETLPSLFAGDVKTVFVTTKHIIKYYLLYSLYMTGWVRLPPIRLGSRLHCDQTS